MRWPDKQDAVAISPRVSLGVTPFDGFYYKSCLHMPLMSAVKHFGGDITPFLMNDVFVYSEDKDATALTLTTLYYEARPELEILEELGIHSEPLSPEDDLIYVLQRALEEQSLILVPVDRFSYYSPYNTLYRREHYPHHVLICGFDRETASFEVIDAPETPIAGQNAFSTTVTFQSLRSAHQDFLRFCEPSRRSLKLSRAKAPARATATGASALRETLLHNQEQIFAGLQCIKAQAVQLRSADAGLLKAEPVETVLRRLFPIERAKEVEYERVRQALPRYLPSLGEVMRRILMSLKEYKLSLGSLLLRDTLGAANRETLAGVLEKIYGLEREFNLSLLEVLRREQTN